MNTHSDFRGHRIMDCFPMDKGQVNVTIVYPGTICAFHRHQKQTDHWIVVKGALEVINVYGQDDFGDRILNYVLKDGHCYREGLEIEGALEIPPTVWHGYRCLGNEPAVLIYYVTEKYNPEDPDEERITPEDLGVEFSREIK